MSITSDATSDATILTACPYCGQTIGASERNRIQRTEGERLQHAIEDAVKAQTAAVEAGRFAAEQRADELQRSLETQVTERVEIEKRAFEAEISVQADQLREEAEEAKQELARLQSEQNQQVEQAILRAENEMYKKVHESEKKLDLAQSTIETLKKQIEGKTAYELGGIQEEELVQLLRTEFPGDRIQRVSGRAGADVEHEVVHRGDNCGVIVYESKNVQTWNNEFIPKLNKDKVELGASHAILVSTAFPAKTRDFCFQGGVCIVHPRLVAHLVRILRQALIDVHVTSLTHEERGSKLEGLMIFLSSPDFKNKIENLFRGVDKLEDLQQKERRAHDKTWDEQTVAIKMIRNGSSDIQNEISAILAGQ